MQKNNITNLVAGTLRSIGASIPFAASFGQAWNELETHVEEERLKQFLEELKNSILKNKENLSKLDSKVTPAVNQLERTIQKVLTESDEKKSRSSLSSLWSLTQTHRI